MKDITTAKTVYDHPEARVINVDIEGLICQSLPQETNLGSFEEWED